MEAVLSQGFSLVEKSKFKYKELKAFSSERILSNTLELIRHNGLKASQI